MKHPQPPLVAVMMRWAGRAAMPGILAAVVAAGCGHDQRNSAKSPEAPTTTASAAEMTTDASRTTPASGQGATTARKTRTASPAARERVLDVERQKLAKVRTLADLGNYLANDGDPVLAAEKLRQFAAQGDAVIPDFKALLADPAPEVARLGAEGLAAIGTPAALQALVECLQALPPDADEQRRELAAILAEQARNAESVPYLTALLEKSDLTDEVRDAATTALAHSLTATDLQSLVNRAAAMQDETTRQAWADVVRQVEGEEYVPQLVALAGDPATATAADPLALAAWDTLAIIGTPQGVAQLLTWTDQANEDAATALAHAIGRIRNPASLAVLQRAAANGTPRQRAAAANALKNFTGN